MSVWLERGAGAGPAMHLDPQPGSVAFHLLQGEGRTSARLCRVTGRRQLAQGPEGQGPGWPQIPSPCLLSTCHLPWVGRVLKHT